MNAKGIITQPTTSDYIGCSVCFRLSASHFLMLALKTSNQRRGHPAITAFGSLALLATAATLNIAARVSLRRNRLLRSPSYQQSGRPSKLALTSHTKRGLLRSSNSRWPPGKPSSAGNKRKLGCISFGYLFFGQAKKSNSPTRRKAVTPIKAQT
jgi:hypothetical protein